MGLRPWLKCQLKCPVALGPGVMLGPHPQGPLQNKGDGLGALLQSPPEGRSPDTREMLPRAGVGWGEVGPAGCCAATLDPSQQGKPRATSFSKNVYSP